MDLVLAGERGSSEEEEEECGIVGMFGCSSSEVKATFEASHCVIFLSLAPLVCFCVKLDLDFLGVSCSPLAHPYIGVNVCQHNVLFCSFL